MTEHPFDGWQAASYSLDHLVPSRWELADRTQFSHLTSAQQMWMRLQPLIGKR